MLLLCALAIALPAGAQASPGPTAPAAAAKPPVAPALSPAETRQMIDLLNDPQKRAAFTATLETLAKAQTVAAPRPAATAAVPLAPDSVGAQVLREGTTWLSGLSGQLASFGRVLGDLPSVWAFTLRTVQNPDLRARALDTGWKLAVVLAAAVLGDWLTWRLLRRPVRSLAAHAPATAEQEHTESGHAAQADPLVAARVLARDGPADGLDPDESPEQAVAETLAVDASDPGLAGLSGTAREDAEVEHVLRVRRFARTIRTLRRLPFVTLCFLLDLVPLGVFIGVGYAGALFVMPEIMAVLQAAILAYALLRLASCVTRAIVAPDQPNLRLVHLSNQGAAYAMVWVRRVFAVGAFGYAASQIGLMFGLPKQADDAFLKAVFLVIHLFLIIIVLQCRASVAAHIRSHSATPRLGARVRNRIASIWHLIAIFYIAGLWMVWAAEVRNGYLRVWHIFLVTMGVLFVGRMVTVVVLGGLDRALRISPDSMQRYPGLEQRANRYVPLLRSTMSGMLVVITLLALLQAWGIDTLAWFRSNALGSRLVSATVTILIAAALAVVVWEAVNASIDNHLAMLNKHLQMVKAARLRTLLPILRTSLLTTLLVVFGMTVLSEIGVNIAPLLAGAGILGVAIGFGSQKLVQDFITGIFLLIENAMQVGDWVTVAGLSGSVENLSIRTMRLRAGDGSVHIIPFSSVSTVTNVNRGIGNAAISVNVPVEEDSDHVGEVLTDIAREMRAERRFADMMRSDLQLWGVDKIDAGVVTIVGQIVCTDSGRWGVQREFNRRMNIRFKELGIRVASPVQTVYNHVATEVPKLAPVPESHAAPASQVTESPPPAALGNTS